MKRFKFGHQVLTIKGKHLSKMIDAVISSPEVTRAEISRASEVSVITAGKLLDALDVCKFTYLNYKYPEGGGRASKHHSINEALSTMVIDVSTSEYSLSIIRGKNNTRFFYKYTYSPEISFIDNLKAFLTRAGSEAIQQPFGIAAIGVILSDTDETASELYRANHIPNTSDKPLIDSLVSSIFGTAPFIYATASEALAYAIQYNCLSSISFKDLVYVHTGRSLRVFHVTENGISTVCRAHNLMINEETTVEDALVGIRSSFDMGKLLSRIFNFADCAFSSPQYVIEYDSIKFNGNVLGEIKRGFAVLSRPVPDIVSLDHSNSILPRGIAAKCAANIIKLHITSSNK